MPAEDSEAVLFEAQLLGQVPRAAGAGLRLVAEAGAWRATPITFGSTAGWPSVLVTPPSPVEVTTVTPAATAASSARLVGVHALGGLRVARPATR